MHKETYFNWYASLTHQNLLLQYAFCLTVLLTVFMAVGKARIAYLQKAVDASAEVVERDPRRGWLILDVVVEVNGDALVPEVSQKLQAWELGTLILQDNMLSGSAHASYNISNNSWKQRRVKVN